MLEDFARVIESARPLDRELSYEHENIGKWLRVVAVKHGDGVVVTASDISHSKEIERALRLSEQRFRAIANYTVNFESWIGADGRVRWVNPAVERLTGYTVDECLTMPEFPVPLICPEKRAEFEPLFREALNGSKGNDVEVQLVRKDGRTVWTAFSWQPILDDDGRPLGLRTSVRDISARKQVERQREQLVTELKTALARVRRLHGMLPICAACKRVRNDHGYWEQIEKYIRDHSDAEFSHGLCPDCARRLYPEMADEIDALERNQRDGSSTKGAP